MNCSKCGTVLEPGSKFCPKCGTVLEEQAGQPVATPVAPVQSAVTPAPATPVTPAPVTPVAPTVATPPETNKKKPLFIIIVVVAVLVALACGFLIGRLTSKGSEKCVEEASEFKEPEKKEEKKDTKEDEEYTYNSFDSSKIEKVASGKEELSKNFEILGFYRNELKKPGKYERVAVYGKNNNSEPVEVKMYLQYFDANGTRIGETVSSGNNLVKPNTEYVIDIDIKDDSLGYSTMKLVYEINKNKSYNTDVTIPESDVLVQTLTNGDIDVSIKNNTDKEVTYGNCGYVFYKDGKIVYAASGYYNNPIPVGGTSKSTFYVSSMTNGEFGDKLKKIEFDEVRFLLFSAYNSNSNY